jgi:peroxin-13
VRLFSLICLAEQFGNLKDTLGSIFGIFTLMRYLRIAIAKLRGEPLPPEEEITPESFVAFNNPNNPSPPPQANRKPLIIFLLALFGLPYLMGKLIRGLAYAKSHSLAPAPFNPSIAELFRATFDFLPQNAAAEVPLRRGDVVAVVARAEEGWWRVRLRDGREGYVPASYLEGLHNPSRPPPIMSPPGEKGHAFIEEFKDE